MNNEPVAWLIQTKTAHQFTFKEPTIIPLDAGVIPLYTHPVNPKYDPETGEPLIDGYPLFSGLPHPVKDKPHPKCDEACMYLCQMRKLTDEEIIELGDKHLVLVNEYIGCGDYVSNIEGEIEFARAILRKAQEK
jgi:hypothetical protein